MAESRSQFTFYDSFYRALSKIKKKADRADAYDAVVAYALTGEEPDLDKMPDAAAIAFEVIRPNLDAARRKAANGKQGGKSRKQSGSKTEANASKVEANGKQEKEQDKEQDKDKEQMLYTPIPPVEAPDLSGMSVALQEKVKQWLDYKRERRESYKPSGLTALLSQIRRCAAEHGEADICELIDYSMSSGYKGILFDRLPKRITAAVGNTAKAMGYGGTMGSLEQEAIKRMLGGNGDERTTDM